MPDEAARIRVLILTADAGFGHRSAANAIAAAFETRYPDRAEVIIENPMDNKHTPSLLRNTQSDYDVLIKRAPELYKLGYNASDGPVPATVMESFLTVAFYRTLRDVLHQHKPDIIISTFPLYQTGLEAIFRLRDKHIPTFTVVTDLATVHRTWFSRGASMTLVPTDTVAGLALKAGLKPEQIKIAGIPVHPRLVDETRSKAELRTELGWNPDLTTLLVVSSKRVGQLEDGLRVINHANLPIQLVVVTGGDDVMFDKLEQTEWHQPTHLYNFVRNMPTMMRAADLIMCKAGGLITTESLACGLPVLLIDLLPGQEEGNADYVVNGEAGALATDAINILEILHRWLKDDQRLLQETAINARKIGKPLAAMDIARMAMEGVEQGLYAQATHSLRDVATLRRLLQRFNITPH